MRYEIAMLVLVLALSGCASVAPLQSDQRTVEPVPYVIADRFLYDDVPGDAQITLIDETRLYRRFEGSFNPGVDDDEENALVTFEYYQQIDNASAPVILVLPILNGKKYVARPFAKYFAKNGYAAIIVDTKQRDTLAEDLINPEKAIRETVIRHRLMLDWVASRPELDANRIAIFGASLGGFNALYVAAVDDRVRAVVPALAAADLPYVFVHSKERRVRRSMKTAMQQLDKDRDEMLTYLIEHLETDTLSIAPHMDAVNVLMVMARFDWAVPYQKQLELREALGNPEAITLPTGHITAAFYIPYLRKKALNFFDRRLTLPTEEPGSRILAGGDRPLEADTSRPGVRVVTGCY